MNRKVWELGVRTALSERWRRGELVVIPESPTFEAVSTRQLVLDLHDPLLAAVPEMSVAPSHRTVPKVLFLLSQLDPNMEHSARNLQPAGVKVLDVREVDVYPLLLGSRVIMDVGAAQFLSKRFGQSDVQDMLARQLEQLQLGLQGGETEGRDDGQTDPETDGGIKEQDVVIEGEEAGVQEKRHPEDPLSSGENAGKEKGEVIRQEMEQAEKKQKDNVESEDRPSAKDLL